MRKQKKQSLNREGDNLPDFNILWQKPSILVKAYKGMLKAKGESMVVRLGGCSLPIRIHAPITLSPEQAASLNLEDIKGKPIAYIEKDTVFNMYVYGDKTTGEEHVALIKGIGNGDNVPIRVHSSCLTAETFHASNCDCHEQLEMALAITEKEGYGGIIWLHQEGRGNGLAGKVKQLKIMFEEGLDTVDAFEKAGYPKDQRDYTVAVDMLKNLGIKSIRLITNNPSKVKQLEELGIKITSIIPCEVTPLNEVVRKDLKAKKDKLGHNLSNI